MAVEHALIDEETPLISGQLSPRQEAKKTPTPLPKLQLSILLLLQLAEPITFLCIFPFINQVIAELPITGGDPRKVGYYAGLIESLFFVTEALTVLQWSRISDRIGRKPVLMIGIAGSAISMLLFGLSRTFWGLVASRCLAGFLNGNVGVMKSMVGDMTDSTNMAQAFAFMPIVWSMGVSIGPSIGGTLYKPYERFPSVFKSQFWRDYPYFLPCSAAAAFSAFCLLVGLVFLKETLHRNDPKKQSTTASSSGQPVALRSLFVFRVIIPILNYVLLALLEVAFQALLPLFYSTAIDFGGLGFSPATIGACMSAWGIMNGLFQATFFAKFVNRFGAKGTFVLGMITFIPLFALFPIVSTLARRWGSSTGVWAMVIFQLMISAIMDMSFGCIFIFITSSAPKGSLGATNGLAQTLVSVARAIGPAASTSLFALSAEHNLMGGYAVYAIMGLCSALALLLAVQLPREPFREEEKQNDSPIN